MSVRETRPKSLMRQVGYERFKNGCSSRTSKHPDDRAARALADLALALEERPAVIDALKHRHADGAASGLEQHLKLAERCWLGLSIR